MAGECPVLPTFTPIRPRSKIQIVLQKAVTSANHRSTGSATTPITSSSVLAHLKNSNANTKIKTQKMLAILNCCCSLKTTESPDEFELSEIRHDEIREGNRSASSNYPMDRELDALAESVNKRHLDPRASKIPSFPDPPREMLKNPVVFHFIRHAQAQHNVPGLGRNATLRARSSIPDPPLTDHGIEQCTHLRHLTSPSGLLYSTTHILVSPLRRTLQTAQYTFNPLFVHSHSPPSMIAWPDLREIHDCPANHCRGLSAVEEITVDQGIPICLELLGEDGKWKNFKDGKGERVKRVREGLWRFQRCVVSGNYWMGVDVGEAATSTAYVAVVGHGDLLTQVAGLGEGGCMFANAEVRSFVFKPRVLVSHTRSKAPYELVEVKGDGIEA